MFTRIDHVMICVPDLQKGIEQYTKMGFNIHPGDFPAIRIHANPCSAKTIRLRPFDHEKREHISSPAKGPLDTQRPVLGHILKLVSRLEYPIRR